jgi:hypothetical protein
MHTGWTGGIQLVLKDPTRVTLSIAYLVTYVVYVRR